LLIRLLEQRGFLTENERLEKYIPELQLGYRGRSQEITIGQCLAHTTGIPWETIGLISDTGSATSFPQLISKLKTTTLISAPGEVSSYATLNYSLFRPVIEKISGTTFENALKSDVLVPLKLNETYSDPDAADSRQMAKGYRTGFLKLMPHPVGAARTNVPSGYILSSAKDMLRWVELNLEIEPLPSGFLKAVRRSHIPAPGTNYASGWEIEDDGALSHDGQNPAFSSFVYANPKENIGIVVLTNVSTDQIGEIGYGILDIFRHRNPRPMPWDLSRKLDCFFTIITVLFGVLIVWFGLQLARNISRLKSGERSASRHWKLGAFSVIIFVSMLFTSLWWAPLFVWKLPWSFLITWGPASFLPAVICTYSLLTISTFVGGAIIGTRRDSLVTSNQSVSNIEIAEPPASHASI
jgi:putative ATP-binding cassette transporter